MEALRIGVLGAARIAGRSIGGPARTTGDRLVAIAARDRGRAEAFATEHGVERVLDGYAEVVADPAVELVYNPLVNGLHASWNLAAVRAGKHVLTEKPSASNAPEAREVRDAAAAAGVVVMEGFHYLFHPVTKRLHEVLAAGELGELRAVEVDTIMPAPADDDPRWSYDLAGGALMDVGCYALHAHRVLAPWAGGEPGLVAARGEARAGRPGVDEWLDRRAGVSGRRDRARPLPDGRRRLAVHLPRRRHPRRGDGRQLRAAATWTTGSRSSRPAASGWSGWAGGPRTRSSSRPSPRTCATAPRLPTDAEDAVRTMELIDECYRAAGLGPRPSRRPRFMRPVRW